MSDVDALLAHLEAIVNRLSRRFDTHDVVQALAEQDRDLCYRALVELGGEEPLEHLHERIDAKLEQAHGTRVRAVDHQHASPDMFGNITFCTLWQKTEGSGP